MLRGFMTAAALALTVAGGMAQSPAREQLARGQALWDQRLAKSAIVALEAATRDPSTAAEAHEALGRLYTFKGWQQDNVLPGWHDEPSVRDRALAELKAAVAADPSRASAREALQTAEGFAAADKVDPALPRAEVKALDDKLAAYRTNTAAPTGEIVAAVEARAKAQADPSPYFAGAQILIDRGEYDRGVAMAERGATVSDHFIDENLSAYQMAGKSQGSFARGHATAADLVGWAAVLRKDYATAATRLDEAEQLFQRLDFGNQVHLGELARAKNDEARALDHYLNALSLAGGPAPLRQRATQTVATLHAATKKPGAFDAWLEEELSRRREDRRANALKSLVDRPLPSLTITGLDGRPVNPAGLRGKVLLLNFFASW